jgi:hypothetical protein
MDSKLVLRLVGLRYKLLWAQTRTRNGRIALFLVGYASALLFLIAFTAGGYGAAMLAVRSGQAELVAQAVLGALFLNAIIASVVMGFGVNAAFSDAALRRFPLNAMERLAARHLTGVLEPMWIIILGLDLGLSTGMYVFGAGGFWLGAGAVVLLVIADYLVARVLASLIEWLSRVRGGTAILGLMLFSVCIAPAMLAPRMAKAQGFIQRSLLTLRFSPPFAAAALVVHPNKSSLIFNLGLMVEWIVFLLAALAAIEQAAARPRNVAVAAVVWGSGYDRVASIFGPAIAPLVARSLRYYSRSGKVRLNFVIALPLLAFVTFGRPLPGDPRHKFVVSLGAFAVVGFLATATMCTNQFGFDAFGFRRYFLLPISPEAILRASSYTALFVGCLLLPIAGVLWLLFAPVPFDWRMAPLLAGSAVGGLLFFNALAIWTSLLAPRRTAFETTFGNQLSLGANVLLIGGILVMLGGATVLDQMAGPAIVLRYWWVSIPAALLAAGLYFFSLRHGTAVFIQRRERLLNALEGRN